MQWRRQKKVTHVIGSSNHVLLLARYQDAPPGEEDEEEGLRKDYVKSQDKDANAHTFDRNGQGGYKPRRTGTGTSGSTSGYASSGSRSHRDESSGSPSQSKIIFTEDEYTKITTPRQDILFKKGYLSRKKPWTAGNASTSATPSTTESQSASHSTADGSETTEDQQLLDRDSGTGEYPPMVESGTQLGYGTFYDHASGYYYEYPVMLVGPAPVPAQVAPSVLAAVPCGPVPLRPIEWINPAFVPKLANQPYCVMDYQASQSTETATIVEENSTMVEAPNGTWNENGTGSASCSGSVAEEAEEQIEEMDNAAAEQRTKEQFAEEQQRIAEQQHLEEQQQHLENGGVTAIDPYMDTLLMQEPPPMHISHVVPAVPQPYIYPGHYMFGPPLVNVNGVTIQGGPLVRTMDVTAMTMACTKRRKKRKKRKQKRPILGNTEDEEEAEYSSECDNEVSSSRLLWSECPTTSTTMTAANKPLNPECQEFQLRSTAQSRIFSSPLSMSTVAEEITKSANDAPDESFSMAEMELAVSSENDEKMCDISSTVQSLANREDAPTMIHNSLEQLVTEEISSENMHQLANSVGNKSKDNDTETNDHRRVNHLIENREVVVTSEIALEAESSMPIEYEAHSSTNTMKDDSTDVNTKHEALFQINGNDVDTQLLNNHVEHAEESLINGETKFERDPTDIPDKSRSVSPQANTALFEKSRAIAVTCNATATVTNDDSEEVQWLRRCNNSSIARTSSLNQPRKYKRNSKFVREPTPGPDLDDQASDVENGKIIRQLEVVELSDDMPAMTHTDDECVVTNGKFDEIDREAHEEDSASETRDNNDKEMKTKMSQETIEGSNEDSGFESQTRLTKYPITSAVTEWLRRNKSPDVFLTSATSDSETDEDDDEEMDTKPPKNLQGNPMPALSANSGVDNGISTTLSRTASCGEFAKTNNNNNDNNVKIIERVEMNSASAIGRRKKDAMSTTRRKTATKRIDKRYNKNVDEKTQSQLVSSLVSCHRLGNLVTAVKLRSPPKSNVGAVCEFTQEDSVAGMRVALSSRINSKKVSAKRVRAPRRINRDAVENIDIRMRRIDDARKEQNGGEVTDDDTVSVRTFEKGEIIVSEDGKFLPMSSYEPVPSDIRITSGVMEIAARAADAINENIEVHKEMTRNNSENDESMMMSSVSIEEPDVLECWEAETVEPVITPKRMLQSPGVLCEGEAVEEDNFEKAAMEHVQKYYRLARGSTEEESSELSIRSIAPKFDSKIVPNNSEKMIEHFHVEEIPIIIPDKSRDIILADEKIPIEEAFEVYESCYSGGKSPFSTPFDSKMFKQQQPFYGQHGEGPIPCRAVCCNIQ